MSKFLPTGNASAYKKGLSSFGESPSKLLYTLPDHGICETENYEFLIPSYLRIMH